MTNATRTHPFDTAALGYDAAFTERSLARWLRSRVWEVLEPLVQPGSQVLELGCGTGEDALWLARRGAAVTATDASREMLAVARAKVEAAGLAARVSFEQLDMGSLDRSSFPGRTPPAPPQPTFDGVLANFGALNCLADRRPLAASLSHRVRPGGWAVFVVMGPFCPWEIGWSLLHAEVKTAVRRFRAGGLAHVGGGRHVRVWYPTRRRLRRELAPFFRHRRTMALGLFLPPSELAHLVDRFPRAAARLAAWEGRLAGRTPFRGFGDHYLMLLEREPAGARQ